MILPLRRVHRSASVALAILLPALLASAWKVRREAVRHELLPEYLPGASPDEGYTSYPYDLVYWTKSPFDDARKAQGSEELPEDAELVGTVRSGALAIQPPEGKEVIVYSLAYDRVYNDSRDLMDAYRGEAPD